MLTECPSCQTVFRVTAAILKMGHGQVRCGKCRTQFDAIECMLDEDDTETQSSAASQESPAATDANKEPDVAISNFNEPTYAEEVVMEGSRIEISGTYRLPDSDGASELQEKIVHEHVVIDRGDLPQEILANPDDRSEPGAEEILDLGADDGEPVADAADHLLDESAAPAEEIGTSATEAPAVPKRWRRALSHIGKRKEEHAAIHAELHALTQRERPRVLRTGVWSAACAVLCVLLLTQVVHHNRDALVRDPRFGNTVSRVYRALGLSPTPHWDLAAYKWDIYKVGLDPKIPEALRVVGSVANEAPFAQPYPLGKLSLQDRWGGAVGERVFEPYEFLPSPEAADRLMAPKQRANIEIVINDPGPDAVGYLIHACLEQDRRLTCADQLPVFK
jgi:predicted Zn finger-like uncharacterized protein